MHQMPHASRSRRSATWFVLLAALALLLSACSGGTSKDDYERDMRAVAADISKASVEVSTMKASASPKQRAATIRRQGDLLAKAADKADAIDPPDDAKEAHEEFIDALRAYAKLLGQLADASEGSAKPEAQAKLLGTAGKQVERLTKASNKLNAAGYDFSTKQ